MRRMNTQSSNRGLAEETTPRRVAQDSLGRTRAGILATLVLATSGAAVATVVAGRRPDQSGSEMRVSEGSALVTRLTRFIEAEMDDKGLPAMSVALVDSAGLVWAGGFGEARPGEGVGADVETVYRVGSVSKLFTDIAVMQLVERGELHLDAPLTDYLPEFESLPAPGEDPSATGPTLRQLMAHRAGLVREPPAGHYFATDEPSLAETVASLSGLARVYPPGERVKYSNAGIALVGYVLEATQDEPFADYVKRAVLDPLGMDDSSFQPGPRVTANLADALMWGYDGRQFAAPTFELGMSPAGSMYSTVADLALFMSAVLAGGVGESGRILEETTMDSMLSPQFGEGSQFGIGFGLGTLDGDRYAGHGGAIYGFATQLGMLPDQKMGAVAVTTVDVSNAVTDRVVDYALRLLVAEARGEALPDFAVTEPVPARVLDAAAGVFEAGPGGMRLTVRPGLGAGGETNAFVELGQARYRLRARGDTLIADDRHGFGGFFTVSREGITARDGTVFTRVSDWPGPEPADSPARFSPLIGEYGWDHNVLFIYEDRGSLHALIEWIEMAELTEIGPDRFAFPVGGGLYHGEGVEFERDAAGSVVSAVAAGIRFPRRSGAATGETFVIVPRRPVEELRGEALAASPPAEQGELRDPDLVELSEVVPAVQYDIRYAGTNNFMQSRFYSEPRAFLQEPAARATARAADRLAGHGFGILVFDAYRPWFVTKMFYDATPDEQRHFVANPAGGSRHNRGAAIDLTLYDLATGTPLETTGGYDEFSERSYPLYVGGTARQRWRRDLLRSVMEAEGFRVYEYEWWHFDYQDWRQYPIMNHTFEEILAGRR